jgi:dolichol-phosphate mannosyltransferase
MIDLLSEDSLPKDAGDFRLIDRKVIDVLSNSKDSNPYLRGMIAIAGFKQIGIPYDRNPRTEGESKFKIKNYIGLALDGIFNHSIIPLRIASFIGFVVSILSIILSLIYFTGKLIYGSFWNPGFATTTILILFSLSLNALFLGIIGEYIGRMYYQVKNNPDVIIDETINI